MLAALLVGNNKTRARFEHSLRFGLPSVHQRAKAHKLEKRMTLNTNWYTSLPEDLCELNMACLLEYWQTSSSDNFRTKLRRYPQAHYRSKSSARTLQKSPCVLLVRMYLCISPWIQLPKQLACADQGGMYRNRFVGLKCVRTTNHPSTAAMPRKETAC